VAKLRAALLFLALAAVAHEEWAIVSADSEPGRDGIVHRHVVLEDSKTKGSVTIDLALFSTNSCTLRVIDQPASPRTDLAHAMRQERCLAGVNGGYFDPDYAPIGLLIADGKVIAPRQRAGLLTGVLAASARGVQILRIRELSAQQKADAAIQCGPFLIDLGQRVRALEATRMARRTFVAVARTDRAALGFCSDVSLSELAKILVTTRLADDFRTERALNLDGGSSSAFWVAREDGSAFSIPEQKTVRDFVAVVPR
jgi:exopolysaccharide biosynthesis protein